MRDWNNPFAAGTPAARLQATKMLLAACALTIALYFVPWAGYVTYPLRIMVTFIHEGCHALVGLLTGAFVQSIAVQPDGSGVTRVSGGIGPLVSCAGYLGATFYGALTIGLLRRGVEGRKLLLATGVAVGLVTLGVLFGLFTTGNFFGLMWGVLLTVGLLVAGLKLSPLAANWAAAFIGIQCVANAFYDLNTLFTLSVTSNTHTDAQNMQAMTMIPAVFWAVLWLATAVAMMVFVLRPGRRVAVVR